MHYCPFIWVVAVFSSCFLSSQYCTVVRFFIFSSYCFPIVPIRTILQSSKHPKRKCPKPSKTLRSSNYGQVQLQLAQYSILSSPPSHQAISICQTNYHHRHRTRLIKFSSSVCIWSLFAHRLNHCPEKTQQPSSSKYFFFRLVLFVVWRKKQKRKAKSKVMTTFRFTLSSGPFFWLLLSCTPKQSA